MVISIRRSRHEEGEELVAIWCRSVDACNFAFFSGLIDAQFWVGSAQPKSPELTANYC